MKTLPLITGIAALLLATGMFMALQAQASALREICGYYDYCVETKGKGNCAKPSDLWDQSEATQWLLDLDWNQSKYARACKKLNVFDKCIADREAGKVKHCYENDRRWRGPWYK
jgi:hypothetical protein